jgi:hypothetical protein
MANLINDEYFIRDIAIPNLNKEDNLSALNSAIELYQEEVLKDVLGWRLYSLFIADPDSEQRFIDIRDGKEFTFDFDGYTITRKYDGLANAKLESLIAYYVYFKYVGNRASHLGGVGANVPSTENANRIDPNYKTVNAWDRFVDLAGEPLIIEEYQKPPYLKYYSNFNRYCGDKRRGGYRSFDKFDLRSYEFFNDSGSLFNFLLANKDVYPEWQFEPQGRINVFGV